MGQLTLGRCPSDQRSSAVRSCFPDLGDSAAIPAIRRAITRMMNHFVV